MVEENAGQMAVAVGLALRSLKPYDPNQSAREEVANLQQGASALAPSPGPRPFPAPMGRWFAACQGGCGVIAGGPIQRRVLVHARQTESAEITTQMSVAERKNPRTLRRQARYWSVSAKPRIQARVDVIDQLRAGQAGPVKPR